MEIELQEKLEWVIACDNEHERDALCEQLCSLAIKEEKNIYGVKKIALALWNKTLVNSFDLHAKAKLRHTAMRILFRWGATKPEVAISDLELQLEIGMKTGKAWEESGHKDFAETAWSLTWDIWNKLANFPNISESSEKNAVKLITYRAEAAASSNQTHLAHTIVTEGLRFVSLRPDWCLHFSQMLYNMAVLIMDENQEEAITFLDFGGNLFASQPRLMLTLVYFSPERKLRDAFKLLALSDKHGADENILQLRLEILIKMNEDNEVIQNAFQDVIQHNNISLSTSFRIIQGYIATHSNNIELAIPLIKQLELKTQTPEDRTELNALYMNAFIHAKKWDEFDHLVKRILDGDQSSEAHLYHLVLWTHAGEFYNRQEWREACKIYSASRLLQPLKPICAFDMAKLLCNLGWCYLKLGQVSDALQCGYEASNSDPNSLRSYYILFRACIQTNEFDKGVEALEKLCSLSTNQSHAQKTGETSPTNQLDDCFIEENKERVGFLCLAVRDCFEYRAKSLAIRALKSLSEASKMSESVVIIRCLIRLYLSQISSTGSNSVEHLNSYNAHISEIKIHLQQAHVALLSIPSAPSSLMMEEETEWFAKVAWNLGIRCGKADDTISTFAFFNLCHMFDKLIPRASSLSRRKMSSFMAATALNKQASMQVQSGNKANTLFEQAYNLIQECKVYLKNCEPDIHVERLLLCAEFHALIGLNRPAALLMNFIEQTKNLENAASTLKIIAGVAAMYGHTDTCWLALHYASQSMPVCLSPLGNSIWCESIKQCVEGHKWDSLVNLFNDALKAMNDKSNQKAPLSNDEIVWSTTCSWNSAIAALSRGLSQIGSTLTTISLKWADLIEGEARHIYRDRLLENYEKLKNI